MDATVHIRAKAFVLLTTAHTIGRKIFNQPQRHPQRIDCSPELKSAQTGAGYGPRH